MEDPLPKIFFILGAILLKGFFALAETAMDSSRKSRLKNRAEGGNKKYRLALETAENPGFFLAAARIWSVFLEILAGLAGGLGLARSLEAVFAGWGLPGALYWAGLFTAAAITAGMVLLGEVLPRQIARSAPEAVMAFLLPFIKILAVPGKPLIFIFFRFSGLVQRFFPSNSPRAPGMTEDELHIALMEGEKSGIVEREERAMVENLFYLGDRPVGTFMTHRSEIQWLDSRAGVEEARILATEYQGQRYFPVAEDTLDKVIGIVSVQDILLALLEDPWPGLRAIMKKPPFVPETMSALRTFEAFKQGEVNCLFIMDEYGGFAGVLSIRNLIEEIVGQLSTTAPEEEAIIRQEDGSWLMDGSVNIDEAAKALSLESLAGEEGPPEYHTLAGFILDLAGEIPKAGASFCRRGFRFTILNMDGNRIDKLVISPSK
jgi:putative hemolysin